MTPQAQRIAIAEACGWKKDVHCVDENENPCLAWRQPGQHGTTGWAESYLPDYLNDLNAMNEAEQFLDTETNLIDDQDGFESARDRYMFKLQSLTDRRPAHQDDCEWQFLTAAAAQRAEAFLRTLNLWDDTK